MAVRKTALMIDDDLVARAKAVLGTKTTTDTIHEALMEVLRLQARLRHLDWMRQRGADLLDPEIMGEVWAKQGHRPGTWGDGCVDTSG